MKGLDNCHRRMKKKGMVLVITFLNLFLDIEDKLFIISFVHTPC